MNGQDITRMLGTLEDMLVDTGYERLVEQARMLTAEDAKYERFMLLCDLVEAHITTPSDQDNPAERMEAVQVITTCLTGLRRTAGCGPLSRPHPEGEPPASRLTPSAPSTVDQAGAPGSR